MEIKLFIPGALRHYTDNKEFITFKGNMVSEVLDQLFELYPALKKHIFSEDGNLRSFVNIFVNNDNIRDLDNLKTTLKKGDEIFIIPSIAGGKEAVKKLSKDEIQRYSRHIVMPEVGMEGQIKLKSASVLLVGMGGLGSPLGMYLAAAGIGTIGMVDADIVDFTNLQRQIMHSTDDVGKPKIESAKKRILGINPDINVNTHAAFLTSENAFEICEPYDIIIDGTDNFATRYLVNDVCVLTGKPNIYGSIFRFEGQVSVFDTRTGPCYRCLYPEPPPPGLVPGCAVGGVFGVLPGIIGTIQATEAVKIILGKGETLSGRLLLFDALTMQFREMKLNRDPKCPICGENPVINKLIDYVEFCGAGVENEPNEIDEEWQISVSELKQKMDSKEKIKIIDVREIPEISICHIAGAEIIPFNSLEFNISKIDQSIPTIIMCRSGVRSADAVKFLHEKGFANVFNLTGGILAWVDEIDPSMPKY